MITVPQMKIFVNQRIAEFLTKEAEALKLDHLGINARQKDVSKVKAYMLAMAEDFNQKKLSVIARERQKKDKRDGTTPLPSQGVQNNPQE